MDTGAEVNTVCRQFARKRLRPVDVPVPGLVGPSGDHLKCFGTYEGILLLTDSNGQTEEVRQVFFAIKRPKGAPPFLLSRPGMGRLGITLNTATMEWYFGKYRETDPEDFADMVLAGEKAYVANYVGIGFQEDIPIPGFDDEPTDQDPDQISLPQCLQKFRDVYSERAAKELPILDEAVHTIDLKEGETPPYGPIYPLSEQQRHELQEYLRENLANGRIKYSKADAGAPVLFVPKKDGTLRLCVDYRGLNRITVKNRYPLPLISDIMEQLGAAKVFSKLDLRDAYHRIRIKEGDQWKTAFRTRYGQFEYTVMPFGLTNAPATFQSYMHKALAGLEDHICVGYLDDILVYSDTIEEHERHLQLVHERLRQYQLFVKASKCEYFRNEVEFLGFIVSAEGISMDPRRVETIRQRPTPESVQDIQVFLGFSNFYRKFIEAYSRITEPITRMLNNEHKALPFDWTEEAEEAFQALKDAFCSATVIRHWDPRLETQVETDASQRAISGILSQKHGSDWRPVAYWSRKLSDTELRWHTGQQELLAIVEGLEHWRHFLEGSGKTFVVWTDHQALKGVIESPARDLRGRLARWVYRLAQFDFDLRHRPGKSNKADGPSRRPDYMSGEMRYGDIIPTLTQKLRLDDELSAETRRSLAPVKNSDSPEGQDQPAGSEVHRHEAIDERSDLPAGPDQLEGLDVHTKKEAQIAPISATARGRGQTCKGDDRCVCPIHRLRVATKAQIAAVTRSRDRHTDEQAPEAGTAPEEQDVPAEPEWLVDQYMTRDQARRVTDGEVSDSDTPSSALYDVVKELQEKDINVKALADVARNRPGTRGGYFLNDDNVLYFRGRLVIPGQGALRKELIHQHHDNPRAGHQGANKTIELLSRKFHWEGLAQDVREYVAECPECNGTRVPRHRPYGQLQSLPLPSQPFQEISLDFITGLPPVLGKDGQIYDAILVVVDRFTKIALFIAVSKTMNAAELASILYEHVECRFGSPEGIVSDRDKLITSLFWTELCRVRETARRVSTAWHPQTDGQTERVHQSLEKYLRSYAVDKPNEWVRMLHEAEFAYNNSNHSSIGCSPFQALYGYHPRMIEYVPERMKTHVNGVKERLVAIAAVRKTLREHWEKAVSVQQRHYNKRHTPQVFEVGQIVGLSTAHFKFKQGKKLSPTYIRVKVLEKVGPLAYRIELPKKYGRVHDVFPVSSLEPWRDRVAEQNKALPLPELDDEQEEWVVEDIVRHREDRGAIEYLVKWEGWPVEYNTWEPKEHLKNAPAILKRYEKKGKKIHKKWDDVKSTADL